MPRKFPGRQKPYEQLTPTGQLRRLGKMVRRALTAYDLDVITARMLNDGENTTFDVRVTPRVPGSPGRYLMRLHRPRANGLAHVASELAWLQALARETGLHVPGVIPTRDGELLQEISLEGVPTPRVAVLFEFLEGRCQSNHSLATIAEIATLTAALHEHAHAWTPPDGFTRFRWDTEGLLGDSAHWGAPLSLPDLDRDQRLVLTEACEEIFDALDGIEEGSPQFGLIHADLHPYNLLHHRGQISVIDFDDCGMGYLHYDVGGFFNAIRGRDRFEACFDQFCEAYEAQRPLYGLNRRRLSMFMLLRQLAQLGWLASRRDDPDTADYLPRAIARTTRGAVAFLKNR